MNPIVHRMVAGRFERTAQSALSERSSITVNCFAGHGVRVRREIR
jgi:hypothetical protein